MTVAIDRNDRNNYRRTEKKLKKVFLVIALIVGFIILILPHIIKSILIFVVGEHEHDANELKKLPFRIINYSYLILIISSFSYMMFLMKKYHRLEYETKSRQIKCYFYNMLILQIMSTISCELSPSNDLFSPTLCFFKDQELKKKMYWTQLYWFYGILGW